MRPSCAIARGAFLIAVGIAAIVIVRGGGMKKIVIAVVLVACGKGGAGGGSKISEAKLRLDQIGQHAKRAAVAGTGGFPTGTAGPTPSTPCCQSADKKCPANGADWNDPIWQALDMRVDDPSYFQLTYTSDGKTFTATAVGDPQCTGEVQTWTARGSIENGGPTFTISEP